MYGRQGGKIERELISGGLSPRAASAIASAISNSKQALEHNGPLNISYIPQQAKLVTGQAQKYQFREVTFTSSDGERRPFKPGGDGGGEEPPPPPPPPGCDLTNVCSRLDDLENRVSQAEACCQFLGEALGAAEGAVAALQACCQDGQDRIKALEDLLKNTTSCPTGP